MVQLHHIRKKEDSNGRCSNDKNSCQAAYGAQEFTITNDAAVADLPTDVATGSVTISIASSKVFIFSPDPNEGWKEIGYNK